MTLARDYDCVCPTCTRRRQGYPTTSSKVDDFILFGPAEPEAVEEFESFCYLGSIVEREGGVKRSVRAKVVPTWNK